MKLTATALASCVLLVAFSLSSRTEASTIVFADDFSSSTIVNQGNPYVGGWFTPQLALQQWTGTTESSITTGALSVGTTNGTRTAGIVLSPTLFEGAGEYVLSFDLTSYSGDGNDAAVATVWAGSGYDMSGSTGNAITVNTYSASLLASGSAQVMQLAAASLTAASNGNEISFAYDGNSAVAIFLGVSTGGWPFPTATYDNVMVSKTSPESVPEPGAMLLLGVALVSFAIRRRRQPAC
jgi:hypothetical protein